MSNRFKIKEKKKKVKKPHIPYAERDLSLHRSFNIFTKDGENLVVNSPTAMTLDEAIDYYKALAISAND